MLAGIPVKVMSFYHGVRRFEGVGPVIRVHGGNGIAPAHPPGTRVRRRSWHRQRLADCTHQWVGAAVGVTTGVVRVLALPPTVAVLSGVNRTSWALSVQCDRMPATSARSPRASPFMGSHAFWANVIGFHVGMLVSGVVAVWDTVAMLLATVTVTVRLVLATWTVTVCAAGVGVSRAAAVVGL